MDLPECNSHAPDSLSLEAVGAGNTSPVTQVQARAGSVEVLCGGSDKSVGVLGIDLLGRLANDVAVEEGHWLAESDSADDEGDEEQGIDSRHNKEAEIGVRPVITDGHHDVQCCDTGLIKLEVVSKLA